MTAVLCKFCGQDISNSRRAQITLDVDGYSCAPCNTFYAIDIYFMDIIDYAITVHIDDQTYHMYFDVFNNNFELQSVYRGIYDSSRFDEGNWTQYRTILRLNFLPDITPVNAKYRIPTLITFS